MSSEPEGRRSRPRTLDGENWRPSRAGAVSAVSIAACSAGALVWTSGLAVGGVAAIAGLCVGSVVPFVTATRHRLLKRACAGPLVFLSGLLLLGCAALTFRAVQPDIRGPATVLRRPNVVGTLLLTVGIAIAAGGTPAVGRDSIRRSDLTSTIGFGTLTLSLPLLVLAGRAAMAATGAAVDPGRTLTTAGDVLFGGLDGGGIRYVDLAVAWTLTLVSITFVVLGSKYLPIAELAPPSRRDRLTARLDRIQSAFYVLRRVVAVAPLVVLLIEAFRVGPSVSIGITDTYLRILSTVGSASPLRWVLLGGIVVGIVGIALGGATKRAAGVNPRRTILRGIPFATGGVVVVAAVQFGPELVNAALAGPFVGYRSVADPVLAEYRPATLVVAVSVAAGMTALVAYVGFTVVNALLLPGHANGAALLSVGLFTASVGSLLGGPSPFVGFVGIAGSFVVWDVSTHAVSLGRELGRHTPTRRAELVHLCGSLLTAALGVTVGTTGLLLTGAIPSPPDRVAPVAAVVSIIGLFALVFSLKGR